MLGCLLLVCFLISYISRIINRVIKVVLLIVIFIIVLIDSFVLLVFEVDNNMNILIEWEG